MTPSLSISSQRTVDLLESDYRYQIRQHCRRSRKHGSISQIKLIDLGDDISIEPTTHHPFTHPTYRVPEGLLQLPWTTKVDVWALGTLVGGQPPPLLNAREKPPDFVRRSWGNLPEPECSVRLGWTRRTRYITL